MKNNVKVLMLAPMSSVHERFNEPCLTALSALGCEIHIACNFCSGDEKTIEHNLAYESSLKERGVITHQIDFRRASLKKNLGKIKEVKKIIKENKFDIVHAHTETGGIITRFSVKADKKCKYMFTPHGMSFYKGGPKLKGFIYKTLEKWICSKMSANMAMNLEELEFLEKWNKNTAYYIHGAGMDTLKFDLKEFDKQKKREELGLDENALVVTSVGELNENKNHKTVISALSKIENKNIVYLICGVGDLEKDLVSFAESVGFKDNLRLLGYRRDIPEILAISDIFAFPSMHEGLPFSLMEAMSSGVAAVCSKIRGNVDLIQDGENGFLCKPLDEDGFKEKIETLISDKELRETFSLKAKETVKEFDAKRVAEEMKVIYAKVLGD